MTVYTGYSVETVAALTALTASERANLLVLYVGEKNCWYRYNPDATGLPDNDKTINPDDSAGRWLAVSAASTGGGEGGGATVGVQNGRPTETPTATGIIVADNRTDRGILWVSVGTDSPADWQVFGYRPLASTNYSNPIGHLTPDFRGQQFIYTEGGQYGSTYIFVATGLTNTSWQSIYSFSNS